MALSFIAQYKEYPDYSKLTIEDKTGVYNVTTNPTGWGTPNLQIGDVLTCFAEVTKPDLTTLLPSSDPLMKVTKDVYYGSVGGVLPNTTSELQSVTALELGYTDEKLVSGLYSIRTYGAGDPDLAGTSFSYTGYFLSLGKAVCCIDKLLLSSNIKDCCGCFKKEDASSRARLGKMYIWGAIAAFNNGLYQECAAYIKRINEICANCIPCGC